MARCFFHLRAGDGYIPDFNGTDMEGFAETGRDTMRVLRAPGARRHDGWRPEATNEHEHGEFIEAIPMEDLLGAVR